MSQKTVAGRAAAALVAAMAWVAPAAAQQAGSGSPAVQQRLILQMPSTDTGEPPGRDASPSAGWEGEHDGCMPAWPCRLRLFGVIERNSGVGIKGTALTW